MRQRYLVLVLLCWCGAIHASSLQELMAGDQLRLRSWLAPVADIVVGQEVQLVIEISTRRWFAGGTRINYPDVKNLLILRRNQFATNLSRREEGSTWVVQQWQLELYPQVEGEYSLPALVLELAVNDATAGIVRGTLKTTALAFAATVPELLQSVDAWLATPRLEVSQEFDRELEALQPGDAFEQVITLRATNVTAMMLPTPRIPQLPGLSAYADNPQLQDRSNRGEATAERIERVTYFVESSGQYRFPEQIFHYWDTVNARVETVSLGAVNIDAGIGPDTASAETPAAGLHIRLHWMVIPALLLLLTALFIRWRRPVPPPGQAQILKAANRALRRGDRAGAVKLLYAWLNREQPPPDWLSLRNTAAAGGEEGLEAQIENLLSGVYADASARSALKADLSALRQRSRGAVYWRRLLPGPVSLELNPGSSAGEQRASG